MARGGNNSGGISIPGKFNGNTFRYRYDSDSLVIDVFVHRIAGLYIADDNTDFERNDLEFNLSVIEHIVRELHGENYFKSGSVRVVFHLAKKYLEDSRYQNISDDFHKTVALLFPLMRQELTQVNRENIRYAIFGFLSLGFCLGIAEILRISFEREGLIVGISQGLSVFGWVIMWRPLDYFIFERRKAVLSYKWAQKLLGSSVETVSWDGNLEASLTFEK